jgi:uncharacterized protein with HEPN domain
LPEIIADWPERPALERVMEVLGEAAKRLAAEWCQRFPAAP